MPNDVVTRRGRSLFPEGWGRLRIGVGLRSQSLLVLWNNFNFAFRVRLTLLFSFTAGLLVGLDGQRCSYVVVFVFLIRGLPSPAFLSLPPDGFRVDEGRVMMEAFSFFAGMAIVIADFTSLAVPSSSAKSAPLAPPLSERFFLSAFAAGACEYPDEALPPVRPACDWEAGPPSGDSP